MNAEVIENLYDDLSVRSKKIIEQLGNVEKAFDYFLEHGNFYTFRNIGKKSNDELVDFFRLLAEKHVSKSNFIERKSSESGFGEDFASIILDFYIQEKEKIRLPKILKALNHFEYKKNLSDDNGSKYYFLAELFEGKNEIINYKGLGPRAEIIIDEFIAKVKSFSLNLDSILARANLSGEVVLCLTHLLNKGFSADLESFGNGHKIFLSRLVFYQVRGSVKKESALLVFDDTFQNAQQNSITELAKLLDLTRERVRQLITNFELNVIPKTIHSFLINIDKRYIYELQKIDPQGLFLIFKEDNDCFDFDNKSFRLNSNFLRLFYACLFCSDYITLEVLLEQSNLSHNIFNHSGKLILIRKNDAYKYRLFELLKFLDEEIYNFEIVDFEFDLATLVRRFYSENKIATNSHEINEVVSLIQAIDRSPAKISVSLSKRLKKEELESNIYHQISVFFETKNAAVKSKEILSYLHSIGFMIQRHVLLNLLNENKEFYKIGADTWFHNRSNEKIEMRGSLTSIVHDILRKSNIPLHISELISKIGTLREIDERSLITTLKFSKLFKFFNCGFIGLIGIDYPAFYLNLPRPIGSHFSVKNILKVSKLYNGDILAGFELLYSYPPLHTSFILNKKDFRN